jgi:hypothetical protein
VSDQIITFDNYRDDEARQLMIASFMAIYSIDAKEAMDRLRLLAGDGRALAYAYREALTRAGRGNQVDYDPCEVGR